MRTNEEIINLVIELRKKKNITASQLAESVGIAKSAMSRYENRTRQFPVNKVSEFANALGTTPEYLLGLDKESDINYIYNQLDKKRQTKVYNYATEQLDRQNSKIIKIEFDKKKLTKVLTAFDVSAGVGYGNDYELTDYTEEYTDENLRNYDFAFRVKGDSMEPDLVTGDVALVQRTESVDNGSIYVVSYSDSLYVKEVRIEDDVFILHSLNPKYQDIPIDLVDNDEPPRIIGRVVDSFTPLQVN
ncbi:MULTISPECIES: S24 family peptidase [unclassified Enterococcus]|uniref:XRE family transcriptional regulator n=1 Tax=unclassified Enterococcus TaxID=2608891 RepID=UPI0015547E68|nr:MULTISPECIES: S24 family peptidase [unclassified Enterococcus]MBS7576496.1 helix-turn-helix domain-containing protein [Enterococcus sp. MMGLQ5-2]MBS7583728.1 helix-turn-helix domain-containing protein [Enterococcus sp. MMGLQ5-1]NPD11589.1 helix-turn-helix domain-containing protein [Enterococcus sp. MMGLQ5-1]NPD36333.1 helix-turn-helix domain-containing protein [Enterococcus sp. MMGLQ5-2]